MTSNTSAIGAPNATGPTPVSERRNVSSVKGKVVDVDVEVVDVDGELVEETAVDVAGALTVVGGTDSIASCSDSATSTSLLDCAAPSTAAGLDEHEASSAATTLAATTPEIALDQK